MKYDMDLRRMDIRKYKIFLKGQYLIPGRQILHENIDDNFKIFENCGFQNYEYYYKENNKKKYYKAKLGLKDMQFVINFANLIVHFENVPHNPCLNSNI